MIQENLFDLTDEQTEASKSIYNGKVIKCLVAPYHSYSQLEPLIQYTPTTYLFPERDPEMSYHKIRSFVNLLVNSEIDSEIRIITSSMSVMMDMIDSSVRILTERNDIIESSEKTFMANIHTLRYKLLEDEYNELSKEERSFAREKVDKLIKRINAARDGEVKVNQDEIQEMKGEVSKIEERIISYKLMEMIEDIHPVKI